jgi:hypothetical protein
VNDELTAIPPAQRRRMALMLAPVGVVLLVAGGLAVSLDGAGWTVAGVLVAMLAMALLGVAWGLWRSAALSEAAAAERRLDEVLAAAARSQGATCGAGGDGADARGAGSQGAGSQSAGSQGADSSICDSTGVICGSSSAVGGCGAACLTRTNSAAERSSASHPG